MYRDGTDIVIKMVYLYIHPNPFIIEITKGVCIIDGLGW